MSQIFATPWAVALQAPLFMEFSRQEYQWVAISSFRGFSRPKDRTCISCITGRFFTIWATRKAQYMAPKWKRGWCFHVWWCPRFPLPTLDTYLIAPQWLSVERRAKSLNWAFFKERCGHGERDTFLLSQLPSFCLYFRWSPFGSSSLQKSTEGCCLPLVDVSNSQTGWFSPARSRSQELVSLNALLK